MQKEISYDIVLLYLFLFFSFMGLFDSIIGTTETTPSPVVVTTDSGSGSSGTGAGSGQQDDTATQSDSIIVVGWESPIDIGGDMTTLTSDMTDSVIITSKEPVLVDTPTIPDTSPLIINDTVVMTPAVPEKIETPILDISENESTGLGTIVSPLESLDAKIAGFITDLENLKANDEMLLQEKEAAIAELQAKQKELEKQVKEIKADERKIDATMASLTGTTPAKIK